MRKSDEARSLTTSDLAEIDNQLVDVDRWLHEQPPNLPGRQPVHTVYVPAHQVVPTLSVDWGEEALAAAECLGGVRSVCEELGVEEELLERVGRQVERKLTDEPIEDLRIDFEDGYGDHNNDTEDAHARSAASYVTSTRGIRGAPPFIGIRFKSLERVTRARGLRTLDIFLSALVRDTTPLSGIRITLPKVSHLAQVLAMRMSCERIEQANGLPNGTLRFEVQVETPQLIVAGDGTIPVAVVAEAAQGRLNGLHFGTYDYTSSLNIAARYQALNNPAASFAKQVMQVATAGTGVRLSDGSSNILPVGDKAQVVAAWQNHAGLVRASLREGYYQGWDLHPAQLLSRYIATYCFYLEGLDEATSRLHEYAAGSTSTIADEPATARSLANYILRGLECGATESTEIETLSGLSISAIRAMELGRHR